MVEAKKKVAKKKAAKKVVKKVEEKEEEMVDFYLGDCVKTGKPLHRKIKKK